MRNIVTILLFLAALSAFAALPRTGIQRDLSVYVAGNIITPAEAVAIRTRINNGLLTETFVPAGTRGRNYWVTKEGALRWKEYAMEAFDTNEDGQSGRYARTDGCHIWLRSCDNLFVPVCQPKPPCPKPPPPCAPPPPCDTVVPVPPVHRCPSPAPLPEFVERTRPELVEPLRYEPGIVQKVCVFTASPLLGYPEAFQPGTVPEICLPPAPVCRPVCTPPCAPRQPLSFSKESQAPTQLPYTVYGPTTEVDLSLMLLPQVRVQQGPAGPQGPQGPAGNCPAKPPAVDCPTPTCVQPAVPGQTGSGSYPTPRPPLK